MYSVFCIQGCVIRNNAGVPSDTPFRKFFRNHGSLKVPHLYILYALSAIKEQLYK